MFSDAGARDDARQDSAVDGHPDAWSDARSDAHVESDAGTARDATDSDVMDASFDADDVVVDGAPPRPLAGSPLLGVGLAEAQPEHDYFGRRRGARADIGAVLGD